MNSRLAPHEVLQPGTRVGEFEFMRALDRGGFGITYLGWDSERGVDVAIKEYMPAAFAVRESEGFVSPITEALTEDYDWGMDEFLKEARMLVAFEHPNIVRVRKWFEAFGTAYFVMDYLEGQTLFALYQAQDTLKEDRLRALLAQVLSGLDQVHASGYLHCDIKPGNIMLRRDGTPVLIDFGAAQAATAAHSHTAPVVTDGYSALEQYSGTDRDYGPWTDIYAVGAVLYCGMTGTVPSRAPNRCEMDILPVSRVATKRYSQSLTDAVDWALQLGADARPQSIDEWLEFLEPGEAPADQPYGPVDTQPAPESSSLSTWRRSLVTLALLAALVFAALAWWSA